MLLEHNIELESNIEKVHVRLNLLVCFLIIQILTLV